MKKIIVVLSLVLIFTGFTLCVTGCTNNNNKNQITENDYRYIIEVNDKYGYINKKGEEVIKPQYNYAGEFSEGVAPVCNNIDDEGHQKCGYIDINGNEVDKKESEVPNSSEFSEIGDFHEGLAYACKSIKEYQKQCGYINKKGEIIIPLKYGYASDFSDGLASVAQFDKNGKKLLNESGYIDKTGKLILKGDYFYDFSDNLAPDISCSKYFDKTGKTIVDISEIGNSSIDGVCSYFNDGLLLIRLKNNYFGYLNKKGALAIKTIARTKEDYSPLGLRFTEDLTYIEINNKWGFIDKTGKIIIKPRFTRDFDGDIFEDMQFKNGLARVKENNQYGYINKNGIFVWKHKIYN